MRPKPSNDYEGAGASSIAIYNQYTGDWTIRTLEGTLLAWAMNWGGGGYQALPGDFDGDGISDLMVYWEAAGLWFGISPFQNPTMGFRRWPWFFRFAVT